MIPNPTALQVPFLHLPFAQIYLPEQARDQDRNCCNVDYRASTFRSLDLTSIRYISRFERPDVLRLIYIKGPITTQRDTHKTRAKRPTYLEQKMGATTELDSTILASLQTTHGFQGKVITPSDPSYSLSLTRWATNAQRPASAILHPLHTQDVSAAVRWAVSNKLPIAVCGGGHSASGASSIGEGGVLIDLGKCVNGVRVDVDGRKGYVGGGAVWKDVDEACIVHGLATVSSKWNVVGLGS
jgi:hypothetical protein